MASLGDILRGAFGGDYSMGKPLDEEELRLMEELRAKGAYVPQERQSSPFSYGAGTASKQNLADIRGAIKPEQERRMKELMFQRGRGARDAFAMEQQQQRQQVDDAIRQRNIETELTRQQLRGTPTTSPQERYAAQTDGSMIYPTEADYVADAPPQRTPQQQAELTALEQEGLAIRSKEQALRTQEIANDVGLLKLEDQQAASDLSQQVRAALPSDYAQTLANKQVVSTELAVLLDKHRLDMATKYGAMLAEQGVNKQARAVELELRGINSALFWLTETAEGKAYELKGGAVGASHRQQLELLQKQLLALKKQIAYYESQTTPVTPGDSDLQDALGGRTSIPFELNPPGGTN